MTLTILAVVLLTAPDWSYYRAWPLEAPLEAALYVTAPSKGACERMTSLDAESKAWWDYLLRCHYCTQREYSEACAAREWWHRVWLLHYRGTPTQGRYALYWEWICRGMPEGAR